MKAAVRNLIGWDRKSLLAKRAIYFRIGSLIGSLLALFPIPLWWLLKIFGSDKHREGGHSYGRVYESMFKRLKYRRLKLLEIGIGGYGTDLGGQSLLAWKAYFPFGRVIGCDIEEKSFPPARRIATYRIDQSSAIDLARLRAAEGGFDIIIDDGSHLSRHQIFTFQQLFRSLRDGGVYVIEDVQTSYWPCRVGALEWDGRHPNDRQFGETCVGYFLELAKYVNHAEFLNYDGLSPERLELSQSIVRIGFEHNLIMILKGRNDLPSNLETERQEVMQLAA